MVAWKYVMRDKVRRSDGVCRANKGDTGAEVNVYDLELVVYRIGGGGDDVHPGTSTS